MNLSKKIVLQSNSITEGVIITHQIQNSKKHHFHSLLLRMVSAKNSKHDWSQNNRKKQLKQKTKKTTTII